MLLPTPLRPHRAAAIVRVCVCVCVCAHCEGGNWHPGWYREAYIHNGKQYTHALTHSQTHTHTHTRSWILMDLRGSKYSVQSFRHFPQPSSKPQTSCVEISAPQQSGYWFKPSIWAGSWFSATPQTICRTSPSAVSLMWTDAYTQTKSLLPSGQRIEKSPSPQAPLLWVQTRWLRTVGNPTSG